MNNLEILKQGYQLFAEGKIAEVTAIWSPDIVWAECTGLPLAHENGIYNGVQEVVDGVLSRIPELYDNFNIEIADFVDGGEKVVMIGYYTGTWKATGRKFKANATHTWTFKNGKATHFFQAVDTAEIMGSVVKTADEKKLDAVI